MNSVKKNYENNNVEVIQPLDARWQSNPKMPYKEA